VDETMTEEPGAYTYEQHLSTGHCDSVIVLQLVVNEQYERLVEDVVCEGDGYNAYGFTIPAAETVDADTLQRMLMLTSEQGCDSVVLLHLVVVDTAVQIISLTPDFCEGLSAELSVITEMTDYQWSTGESMPQITVTMPGIYSVTATEGDCESTARYTIEPCEFQLLLPNAITPSKSDGLNDYFSIPEPMQRSFQDFEISIFNRWGSMVYYSTDKNFRWNGEVEGKIYYNNVYTYIIRCTNAQGKAYMFKGSVTVL
jgi:gliding motility-associated-like protein